MKSITHKNGATTLGNLTYGFDPDDRQISVGGSLASTSIPTPQTFSYNIDNSLKTFGSSTVTNDKDGAITCLYSTLCNTSSHAGTFSWDSAGQLQETIGTEPGTEDTVTEEAGYDPFGRRIASAFWYGANGPYGTAYLYDGLNPIQENAGVAGVNSTLLAGLALDDNFSSGTDGVPAESFLTDPLNSVVAMTDSSGNINSSCTYEPYGYSPQGCDFIGRENDEDGLYFFRSRYYAPELGRFISRDPAGLGGGGANLYAYAGDDPVNFSDPMGREYGFPIGGSYGFYNGVFGNNGGGWGGYYGGTGGVGIVGAYGIDNTEGQLMGLAPTYGVGWFGASIGAIGGLGRGMGPAKPLPNLDGIYQVQYYHRQNGGVADPGGGTPEGIEQEWELMKGTSRLGAFAGTFGGLWAGSYFGLTGFWLGAAGATGGIGGAILGSYLAYLNFRAHLQAQTGSPLASPTP